MNEIDRLKEKLQQERNKNKELKRLFREKKRKILEKMKQLEEDVKDIMYIGEWICQENQICTIEIQKKDFY